MPHTYDYARPALTVDIVVFALDDGDLNVMLIQRGLEPFRGRWALPGGFIRENETLKAAAERELKEETGLKGIFLEQFGVYDDPERDPRERVISVAFYGLVNLADHEARAQTDASDAAWFEMDETRRLAFDHDSILKDALARLREDVRRRPIGFELLPGKFPLRSLQNLYERVLGRELDRRNFRKKIHAMDILVELDEIEKDVSHRAAKLYRFDKKKYARKEKSGFHFEI